MPLDYENAAPGGNLQPKGPPPWDDARFPDAFFWTPYSGHHFNRFLINLGTILAPFCILFHVFGHRFLEVEIDMNFPIVPAVVRVGESWRTRVILGKSYGLNTFTLIRKYLFLHRFHVDVDIAFGTIADGNS